MVRLFPFRLMLFGGPDDSGDQWLAFLIDALRGTNLV